MSEITHDNLDALADRLESSFRREVDQIRDDISLRVGELRDQFIAQNGRVGKAEAAIIAVEKQVVALRHDLTGHLNTHESFAVVVAALRAKSQDHSKPNKAFVAGAVAVIVALSGVASVVVQLGIELMKKWKP